YTHQFSASSASSTPSIHPNVTSNATIWNSTDSGTFTAAKQYLCFGGWLDENTTEA
ncbi:hypothetical protein FOZ62_030792, partial [Perkinsus olseni]